MESKKIRLSPLKINKESRSIRKPPIPLPMVQYRQPVIIHTYSPKIIETDANNFMWLVQKLTGSIDTRLRCENSKPPKNFSTPVSEEDEDLSSEEPVDDKNLVISQLIPKEQILLSPTSSADSGFFGRIASTAAASPKSPLLGCYRETTDYVPAALSSSENEAAGVLPWSPATALPTPNALSHDFLAEISSIFGQDHGFPSPSPALDLSNHSSSFGLSPHGRIFGALPSPATMAYRDYAMSFIKDPASF